MFSGSIHTHSENSLTDSVASVEELVARAKEMGAPAMALTDHGTLIGTWDFLDACNSAGIKGIVGVEFYVGNNGQREHWDCCIKLCQLDNNNTRSKLHTNTRIDIFYSFFGFGIDLVKRTYYNKHASFALDLSTYKEEGK